MTAVDEQYLDVRLSDGTPVADLVDADLGKISRRIYGGDPEVFELEMERIFRRAWQFIGHESEVPEPGSYVTRLLGNEPVVMIRDDEGAVKVFFNSCRHRGMRVCNADSGSVRFIRCPYHGWTYGTDGSLIQAFAEELYREGDLNKAELGLIPVRSANYHGLVFGTWDDAVPEFVDYLGDMRFYWDMLVARSDRGTEVMGPPQVWEVKTNWKFATDNFTGDNFHVFTAHGSLMQINLLPDDEMAYSHGVMIDAGLGHQLHQVEGPPGDEAMTHYALPPNLREQLHRNLNEAQLELASHTMLSVGTVFPNLSFLQIPLKTMMESDAPATAYLNIRLWVPTSPTSIRIHSWLLVEKDAEPEYRKAAYEAYVRTFGPGGVFEQDDTVNWEECTRVNVGKVAQRHSLHHRMAIHHSPMEDFPGPGRVYERAYGEKTQLAFYDHWKRCLTEANPWAQRSEEDDR